MPIHLKDLTLNVRIDHVLTVFLYVCTSSRQAYIKVQGIGPYDYSPRPIQLPFALFSTKGTVSLKMAARRNHLIFSIQQWG